MKTLFSLFKTATAPLDKPFPRIPGKLLSNAQSRRASRACTRAVIATLVAAFSLVTTSSSHAQLLAYESFNYAPGNAFGNTPTPTTASGFSGNFEFFGEDLNIAPNASTISAGSLSYTDGNSSALSTSNNSYVNGHGRLAETFDLSGGGPFAAYLEGGNIGANLTTLYMSFTIQIGGATGYNAFELFRDTAADSGRILSINNWTGHGSSNYHLTVGEGANGGTFGGSPTKNDNLDFSSTGTVFFVLRFNFGMVNTDSVLIYANPLLSVEPGSPTGQVSGINFAFDRIGNSSFGGGSVQMLDEIRVGTTYASVTGVPEPTSTALLVSGAAMLWTAARRRRQADC